MRRKFLILTGPLVVALTIAGCTAGGMTAEHSMGATAVIGGSKETGRMTMRYAEARSNYFYVLSRMKDVPLWASLPEHPTAQNIDAMPEELEALIDFRNPRTP